MRLRRADMAGERGNADVRTRAAPVGERGEAGKSVRGSGERAWRRERADSTSDMHAQLSSHTLRPTGQRVERTWWASTRDAGKSRGSQRAWRASAHGSRRA
jgi:hypothetical protein